MEHNGYNMFGVQKKKLIHHRRRWILAQIFDYVIYVFDDYWETYGRIYSILLCYYSNGIIFNIILIYLLNLFFDLFYGALSIINTYYWIDYWFIYVDVLIIINTYRLNLLLIYLYGVFIAS